MERPRDKQGAKRRGVFQISGALNRKVLDKGVRRSHHRHPSRASLQEPNRNPWRVSNRTDTETNRRPKGAGHCSLWKKTDSRIPDDQLLAGGKSVKRFEK